MPLRLPVGQGRHPRQLLAQVDVVAGVANVAARSLAVRGHVGEGIEDGNERGEEGGMEGGIEGSMEAGKDVLTKGILLQKFSQNKSYLFIYEPFILHDIFIKCLNFPIWRTRF